MTYSKMPLKSNQRWPKQFGFEIVGQGPCFILRVEKGSVAYNSGLQPGDQILEFDDQDVTNMSAEALKTLSKHSRTLPPTLGVVSRLLHTDMVGSKAMGLGLMINEGQPVTVNKVETGGPAQTVGIRPGDIIIEVNGKPVNTTNDLKPHLPSYSKRVSISYIPVGKFVVPTTPTTNGKGVSEGSRVKRAKDLHEKMNEILGDDYEKKMAVIGVLKQYAEDRDIDMLARALAVILKTPSHRKLVRQIRPFIPPRQRTRFDDITKQQQQYMSKESPKHSNRDSPTAHKVGQRRALQIVRENGSFGLVVKGSNPAYIETVDPNGPAERAGLQTGDFIMKLNGIDIRKCGHAHLVNLLQDSGTAPIIEILRCDGDEYPFTSSAGGSCSSVSSSSSHTDSEWMSHDHKVIVDNDGRSYQDRSEFLLTTKEKSHIRKALVEYDSTCNIVELFESISQVLDTPSKKTLWMFIMARLSTQHQQYCINQINLPRNVLLECVSKQSQYNRNRSMSLPGYNGSGESSQSGWESQTDRRPSSIKISSFQQQVEYLLTSRERSVLKKALQLYSENRNVDHLVEDLDVILDTPSKGTLWMYIIPLLSQEHQDIVRQRVNDKSSVSSAPSTTRKTSDKQMPPYMSSEEDEHDLFSKTGARKMKSKPGSGTSKGVDLALIRELEETRKVVQEAKQLFTLGKDPELDRDNTRYITVIPIDRQQKEGASVHSPLNILLPPGQPYPSNHMATPLLTTFGGGGRQGPMSPQEFDEMYNPRDRMFSNNSSHKENYGHNHLLHGDNGHQVGQNHVYNSPQGIITEDNQMKFPANFMHNGNDSDPEGVSDKTSPQNLMVSKFSKMGGGTFNRHALTALKQLDAAVAAEVSDLENSTDQSSPDDKSSPVKTGVVSLGVPPPPPPPPPVAPPAPSVSMGGRSQDINNQMNVKRINWEKLDQQKVENTVWQQLGDTTDLQDVVKFLELEQCFATKTNKPKAGTAGRRQSHCGCVKHRLSRYGTMPSKLKPKMADKKTEVCILNHKKSYNISILLGHLKLSLSETKHALYVMDEDILTPELLRQLLAYAPNTQEMEQLDSYNGGIENLSQPDRFTYEMSRVPGYEQRLKALLFKGNFQEKITEMKEHLQYIRKASLELRNSKRLSKILELILAMGNYMNQGNQRVGEAAGFKIKFLTQLEITKTADNKFTFLHVLAEAVNNKFQELLAVGEELTTVPEAAKFSNVLLNQELQDLRKVLQDISITLEKFGSQKTSIGINDRFQDVMGHFISQASDEIQSLFRLNANTMEEFQNTVQYFGEDGKKMTTTELFGVFADFITKFEKAHRHNIMYKRYP